VDEGCSHESLLAWGATLAEAKLTRDRSARCRAPCTSSRRCSWSPCRTGAEPR